MLKNYLTIAVRNFMKHKLYSAINVLGLGLGMASCILMILFVRDELSYDRSFPNVDNTYRVQTSFVRPNGDRTDFATSVIHAIDILEAEVPEVEATQYMYAWQVRIAIGDRSGQRTVNFVAPDFFEMFPLAFLAGDPARALDGPNQAIISAELADRMFPGGQAMGRRFILEKDTEVVVTGILAPDQPNTHFETEVFVSRSTVGDSKACGGSTNWNRYCAYTYVTLTPGTDPAILDAALPDIVERYAPPIERLGLSWKGSDWLRLSITPVKDIHLKSRRLEEMKPAGDLSLVYVFSFLAVLILIIACINFTNLATARASDRSQEISIRKIVGAERRQIFIQILGESVLLSSLALIIAFTIVEVSLPLYNEVIGKTLTFTYLEDWKLMAGLLAASVAVGFAGGTYPALFLSSFRPITLSKGVFANVDRHLFLRSTLVVIQFAISVGLMSATFVVYAQMNYARAQALHVKQGSILTLNVQKSVKSENRIEIFREIVTHIDGVDTFATSSFLPPREKGAGVVRRPMPEDGLHPRDPEEGVKVIEIASVDGQFFPTYGVDVVAGRLFDKAPLKYNIDRFDTPSPTNPETSASAVINESATRYLGFDSPQDAIGQTIDFGLQGPEFVTHMKVIGVVPDVNFASAREDVAPTMFYMEPSLNHAISILLDSRNTEETVKHIKLAWTAIFEDEPLRMQFVDESYDKLFAQEVVRGNLFAGFSLLAMFIACLGLYGLAAVSAERRTQEIGLRKVMGASVWDIVRLLVWQFSQPVLIANLIAWPIAFWAMRGWLNGFSSHVELTPAAFLAATAITVLVALATVTWHARKVAMAKPADTLRYE